MSFLLVVVVVVVVVVAAALLQLSAVPSCLQLSLRPGEAGVVAASGFMEWSRGGTQLSLDAVVR